MQRMYQRPLDVNPSIWRRLFPQAFRVAVLGRGQIGPRVQSEGPGWPSRPLEGKLEAIDPNQLAAVSGGWASLQDEELIQKLWQLEPVRCVRRQ